MKTTLYFILTLLTFVTFMFVPNSFAQGFSSYRTAHLLCPKRPSTSV